MAEEFNLRDLANAIRRPHRRHVKAPTFDGKDNVRDFLRLFNNVREANEWNDDEAGLQLKLSLEGSARTGVMGDTIEELTASLLARFELTQDEARSALKNAKLRAGENIYQFGDYLMRMVTLAHPNLNAEQRNELATSELVEATQDRRLKREFKLQRPDDFMDAMRRVQEYNSDMGKGDKEKHIRSLEVEESNEVIQLKKDMDFLKDQQKETKDKMEKLESSYTQLGTDIMKNHEQLLQKLGEKTYQPKNYSQQPRRRSDDCYNCGKKGHFARECRSSTQNTKKQFQKSENTSGSSA